MSADIMPCGCEGHADNADLCQYPALETEAKALRARVAELEKRVAEARKLFETNRFDKTRLASNPTQNALAYRMWATLGEVK